jgi:HEAT repeat protein
VQWWNERQLRAGDPSVRITAARQIAQHPSRQALPALVRALADPDPVVRDEVRLALEACDPNWRSSDAARREVPRFVTMVQNAGYLEEREPALKALADIGDKRGGDALFNVLRTDKNLAFEAMAGLIKMRDPRAFNESAEGLKSELKLTRNHHAENLIAVDDPKAVPILIEALPSTGDGVIKALGHYADPRSAVALVEYYRREADNKTRSQVEVARDITLLVSALQAVLQRAASDIPATALKPMANFEDRDYADTHIDWSSVRKLARDELKRRGIT